MCLSKWIRSAAVSFVKNIELLSEFFLFLNRIDANARVDFKSFIAIGLDVRAEYIIFKLGHDKITNNN